MKATTRTSFVFSSLLAYALIVALVAGCGNSSNSPIIIVPSATPTSRPTATSTPTATPTATQTPNATATPTPAPFDTGKGEGNLLSSKLVVTYPTAASASELDPSALALNTSYLDTICPEAIGPAGCTTNKSSLNTTEFGNFDVDADPIGSNALGIKTVNAVKIDYTAINVNNSALTVSGGIVIPNLPPASLKGMVLYFHGTTVLRTNVPSNFLTSTNEANANTDGILLAAVLASQGYVVVMPDYIGLGDDTSHPHPYVLYPQQNAQSGLAMVKAARSYLATAYGITRSLPLHITGYSEGGAYALEAAHLMQNNPAYAAVLDVGFVDAAPLSGAFDLTGTMLPYLFFNISVTDNPWFSLTPLVSAASKPYLTGDIVLSFANYSGIAPTAIVPDAFYTCLPALPCGSSGNLDGLYYTSNSDQTVIEAALAQATKTTAWSLASNAITPLLTDAYATALMDRDPSNPLYKLAAGADTYLFVPEFPITIVSLMMDSVVTRINSDVAFSYFMTQNPGGPYQEKLVDNTNFLAIGTFGPGPVDHTSELPFLSVLILNQFNNAK
jgi:hypothetical protein